MRRHNSRSFTSALFALALLTTASAAQAQVQISEVLYNGVGSDAPSVFVELTGPAGQSLDGFVEVEVVESVAFRGVEMPARSTTTRGPSGARSWSRVRYAEAPEFLETEAAERFRIDAVPPEFESMPFRWLGDFRCGNE